MFFEQFFRFSCPPPFLFLLPPPRDEHISLRSRLRSFPNWQRGSRQPYIFLRIRQCFAVLMLSFYSLGSKQLFCWLSTWTETKEVIRRIGLFWIQHRPDGVFRINHSSREKNFSNRGQAKQAHRKKKFVCKV